jgi:hypothetical protein
MLDALNSFRPYLAQNFAIRSPLLYHFDRETCIQVLEDLVDTIDLKTVLESPKVLTLLPVSISNAMGYALGAWLRSFHSWVSAAAQAGVTRVICDNTPMRKIRFAISYGAFTSVIQKFPEIWEAEKQALEDVKNMATLEYAKAPQANAEESWGVIHGDFWTGK